LIDTIKSSRPETPIIAVLAVGRPVDISAQLERFDAVIMAGWPGSEGAGAADVLLGDKAFTGRLTMTWPLHAEDIGVKLTDPSKVLFPYGAGLK
jgi:beta-glucosidase